MSDDNALLRDIDSLQARIDALKREQNDLLQQWAAAFSRWKVGDVVDAVGYSHAGKKVRVTKVSGRLDYDYKPKIDVEAVVLKKDGTDSLYKTSWAQYSRGPAPDRG